jgi:hypothetical protein
MLRILLLLKNGKTEWRVIPWGKAHLDWHRKDGDIVFSEEIHYG